MALPLGDFFSLGAFGAQAFFPPPLPFFPLFASFSLRAFCLSALAALRASFLALASAAAPLSCLEPHPLL